MIEITSPDGLIVYHVTEISEEPLLYELRRYDRSRGTYTGNWKDLTQQQITEALKSDIGPIVARLSREAQFKANLLREIDKAGAIELAEAFDYWRRNNE